MSRRTGVVAVCSSLIAVCGLVTADVTRAGAGEPRAAVTGMPSTPVFPPAVDLSVDYGAKTITVTARIDFYQDSGSRVSQGTIDGIVATIVSAWNGHKFKCFSVIVRVDVRAAQNRGGVRPDAVDVRLDNSRLQARSSVVASRGGNVPSDDPADRIEPGRDLSQPGGTTWGRYTDPSVWAHEFGHVLGLHDNYDPSDGSRVVTGARRDMMFSQGLDVSAEMITRVIRRNNRGQLDESRIKCPLTLRAGPASVNLLLIELTDLQVHAYACDFDPPSDDPSRRPRPITWNGTAGLSGSYNIPVLGGSGSYSSTITFTSEAEQPYTFTLSSSTGSATFGGKYRWTTRGVPENIGPMTIGGVPSDLVGLGLYPVFTEGAPECP